MRSAWQGRKAHSSSMANLIGKLKHLVDVLQRRGADKKIPGRWEKDRIILQLEALDQLEKDRWFGNLSIVEAFPPLLAIARVPSATVAQSFNADPARDIWAPTFRRNLHPLEMTQRRQLLSFLLDYSPIVMEGRIARIDQESVDPGSDRSPGIRFRAEVPPNPSFEGGSAQLAWIRVGSRKSPMDRSIHARFCRSGGIMLVINEGN
ncbi:hypothetical protein Taro_005393 [Colocasia esculenta]|uniref:Uncharacterized protein n=1 Tax=Colocasia esculenta TaxID=4460 RepID=A0A843TKT9_COLES|nr:hypothetical protein [Colocasia esculenta]